MINEDISLLQQGSYIWTAKDKTQLTWGVYKYMSTDLKITSITASASNIFTVTLNKYFAFEKGDVIGINDVATGTDGFYTINKVELNVLSLDSVTDVPATEDTYTANTGFITRFKAVRVSNLTEANNNIQRDGKQLEFTIAGTNAQSDTIWVDDDDTGKWVVLKSKQVFELKPEIVNKTAGIFDSTEKDFGASLSVSDNNNLMTITAPKDLNGTVYVLTRPSDNTEFAQLQQIDETVNLYDSNGAFGTSAVISPDGKYLAIGSPNASNVKSKLKGDYRASVTYETNDLSLIHI